MDHPGALRHATDREPAAPRDGDLRAGVGRQDRARGRVATVGGELAGGGPRPGEHLVERQAGADHARREDEHLLRLEPERLGETDSRGDGVLLALRPRRGIRDAGVDQHGLRLGEREMALRDGDRSRLDAVRRPQRGADRGRNGAHDGDVGAARTA